MKFTLRKKIIIIMVFLITIPMVLLGSVLYYNSSNQLQSSTEEQLVSNVNNTASIIQNEIDALKNYVKLASVNNSIVETTVSSNEDMKGETKEILKKLLSENANLLESMWVVGRDGKIIVNAESTSVNVDVSDRDYFKTAISGIDTISDVLISKTTNEAIVVVAVPLKSGDNIVGVLSAGIKFSTLSDYISKVKVGESGYGYMINRDGLIVYHPNKDKVLNENSSDTDNADLKNLIEKMKNGESGQGYYTYEGSKKYMAYVPVSEWTIAVTVPYDEYMKPAFAIRKTTIAFVLVFSLVAIFVAFMLATKSIITPIKKLEKAMILVGQGDLSVRTNIQTGDEIEILGSFFNKMLSEQEQIVAKVRQGAKELVYTSEEMSSSAEEISSASTEITSSIQVVAEGAYNQNQSVIEASKVLTNLSSQVKLAQTKAISANESSILTKRAAETGRQRVDDTVRAMDIINSSTEETAKVLKTVNQLSDKVEEIIITINSIAEQTNLLALNAAIEAARAGEHGRGFTVVAEEVRKLSEESNSGSKEISTLISEMVKNIEKAVTSMDSAINAVKNGVAVVSDTDGSLVNIINAAEKIGVDIEEMVSIANEEVVTSEKVIALIKKIGDISEDASTNSASVASSSEEQTATVETLAATAEEVSALANELETMVDRFKVTEI
ncbi:MAG: methyl-accepting chemotaxis protein [Clostridiaceae bacterium]